MSTFSQSQVVRYCVLTAVVTALVGLVFVETGYQPLRRAVADVVRGSEEAAEAAPRSADLRDSTTRLVLDRRTQEILAARQVQLGPEKQKELMRLWHELRIWQNLWYMGIRIQKNPMDTWMVQQLFYEVQPDIVIETGTAYGGSALLWAHFLDGLGLKDSKVITIDITDYKQQAEQQPLWQQYVHFLLGSSTDPAIVDSVRRMAQGKKVLVMLDSNHEGQHVLDELRAYGPMVSPGSYIVAEDTNLDGIGLSSEVTHLDGPGPQWGVTQYLAGEGKGLFEPDYTRENFVLTFNPGGWLRRVAP